jgi:hypothetical protein
MCGLKASESGGSEGGLQPEKNVAGGVAFQRLGNLFAARSLVPGRDRDAKNALAGLITHIHEKLDVGRVFGEFLSDPGPTRRAASMSGKSIPSRSTYWRAPSVMSKKNFGMA